MSEVRAFVDAAWMNGVGPDDRERLAALVAHLDEPAFAADPALPTLRVFAALFDLLVDVRVAVPPSPSGPSSRALHAAAVLEAARLEREPERTDAAIERIAVALDALDDADPHAAAARAWCDLALGDLALSLGDLPAARRRFESASQASLPAALRITAMLRLARSGMDALDVAPAREWARRAVTLAEQHERYEHGTRARLLLGMLHYLHGDRAAMRKTLRPHAKTSVLARILLASTEGAGRAMELLAEGLRVATEQGDVMSYMICILIGTRRYEAIGRDADALITVSAGIRQLAQLAPELSQVLVRERASMQTRWGADRCAEAERRAVTLLDRAPNKHPESGKLGVAPRE